MNFKRGDRILYYRTNTSATGPGYKRGIFLKIMKENSETAIIRATTERKYSSIIYAGINTIKLDTIGQLKNIKRRCLK